MDFFEWLWIIFLVFVVWLLTVVFNLWVGVVVAVSLHLFMTWVEGGY